MAIIAYWPQLVIWLPAVAFDSADPAIKEGLPTIL
jgi:hypothetical protein